MITEGPKMNLKKTCALFRLKVTKREIIPLGDMNVLVGTRKKLQKKGWCHSEKMIRGKGDLGKWLLRHICF